MSANSRKSDHQKGIAVSAPDEAHRSTFEGDYAAYLDHRKHVAAAATEAGNSYDKWLLTLTGAGIGLSITFLKDVLPHGIAPRWAPALLCAWILWALAAGLCLVNMLCSQKGNERIQEIMDEEFQRYKATTWQVITERSRKVRWISAVSILNVMTLACFLVGLVLVLVFVYVNWSSRP